MSAPSRLSKTRIQFELALMINKWVESTQYYDGGKVDIPSDYIMILAKQLSCFVEECQDRR